MSAIIKRNNVHILGSGAKTLLFVNGFGCDQTIWRYVTPALSGHFRLVMFDHVGAGLSDLTAYDPGQVRLAGRLRRGCARYLSGTGAAGRDADRALGGAPMIGMLAAIREPAWFQQLLLLCPSPCYLNEPNYHGGFERQDIH